MNILGFELVNEEKIERAMHGTITRGGVLKGGVGDFQPTSEKTEEEERTMWEMKLMAEYDRLGGLVLKEGLKVKTGAFYSFETKKSRQEPVVTFITEFEGQIIEVDESEARTLKLAKEKTEKLRKKLKEKDEEGSKKSKKLKKSKE